MRLVIVWLLLAVAASVGGGDRSTARAQEGSTSDESVADSILLVGGRLMTLGPQGTIEADLLIADGKIARIGPELSVGDDVRRIDVRGMTVTPGLIDARGSLWLTSAATRDGADNAGLNALDGVDLFAEDWREVARQGVTSVYVQPAASGNLGGRGAVLRVAPARSIEELVLREDAAAQASIGVGARSGTSRERFAQYEKIKKALEAAKKYGEQLAKYEEYQKKQQSKKESRDQEDKPTDGKQGEGNKESTDQEKPDSDGKPESEGNQGEDDGGDGKTEQKEQDKKEEKEEKPPEKPTPDPAKDFLLRVLSREIPLRVEARRDDDIAHALKLAEEFDVRVTIDGADRPRSALDKLRDRRVPLVLGPIPTDRGAAEPIARRADDWLQTLTAHDARFAIATFAEQPRASRLLRAHAAAAVAAGLDPQDVLKAMTSSAAAILGLDDSLGTLEEGKQADVVAFAGHPLDPSTRTRLVVSKGRVVHEAEVEPAPELSCSSVGRLPDSLPSLYGVRSQRFLLASGVLGPGQLVIEQGKVRSFGRITDLPEDIPVHDLGTMVVTPPLMVAHAGLGQDALIADTADALAPELRSADALDPGATILDRFRRQGFLCAALAPGSGNVLGGSMAMIRIGSDAPVTASTAALKFTLTADSRDADRFPASLAGQCQTIRDALDGRVPETALWLPDSVRGELAAERRGRLEELLKRESVGLFEVSSDVEIRAALGLIERFKLRAALVGPERLLPHLDELLRLDVAIVARPVRPDDYDRYLDELSAASKAGVKIVFGAESPRRCRTTAALAVTAGMSPEAALSGLTDQAARLFDAARGHESFAEQSPADFVVWGGSPLNLCQNPHYTVSDGKRCAIDD